MTKIILATCLPFWAIAAIAFSSRGLAQIGPDPFYSNSQQNNADINEVEDVDTEGAEIGEPDSVKDEKDANTSDDRELRLSQSEMREDIIYGAAVGVGLHDPWQLASLSALYLIKPDLALPMSVGGGAFEFKGTESKKSYQIDSTAKSLHVGLRKFFTDMFPLYAETGGGYVFWNGRIKPTGSDLNEEEEAVSAKLRSSFDSSGPVISLKIGIQTMWKSGVYIDYCLVGMAKSWVASQTLTRNSSEVTRVVREKISDPIIWGLSNIRVGWLF
jgi:hypothetical protein